jgi:type VI secretion system protein ImpA
MNDWAALLAPVSADDPAGEDLSFSLAFDEIAEMRRADDPSLSQGEWVTALKVADWPGVAQACEGLLRTRTKDLRLAMWLTEAWAWLHGAAGLADGLQLTHGLCQQHWDGLHPRIEDGDADQRVGNLSGLLQRLVEWCTKVPLIAGTPLSLQAWHAARALQVRIDRGEGEPPADGQAQLTLAALQASLRQALPEALQTAAADLLRARTALAGLQEVVDAQLGAEGPGFVQAREALEQAAAEWSRLLREAGLGAGEPAAAEGDAPDSPVPAGVAASPPARGPLASRAQALQQLREVADYFRRTEPHSPVAYLADKAVQWGNMPLHEWLRVVLKDPGALAHVEELLGLPQQGR